MVDFKEMKPTHHSILLYLELRDIQGYQISKNTSFIFEVTNIMAAFILLSIAVRTAILLVAHIHMHTAFVRILPKISPVEKNEKRKTSIDILASNSPQYLHVGVS